MKTINEHYMKKSNGFTLIELLVVLAIIAILTSILLFNLVTARKQARDAQRREAVLGLAAAIGIYADEHNSEYPIKTDLTVIKKHSDVASDFNSSYILDMPKSVNNKNYYYVSNQIGTDFAFFVELESKKNTWFCFSSAGSPYDVALSGLPANPDACFGSNS